MNIQLTPLRLVLALVLTIVVAVGSAVVGARLAASSAAPATTSVIAIAPSAHGTARDVTDLPSPEIGTKTVSPVLADPAKAFRSFLSRVGSGSVGVHTPGSIGTVADVPTPPAATGTGTPAGDPCAPASGNPPAGCPGGVRGAIYASLHDRPLVAAPEAFPPTYADFLAHGNPYGSIFCPVDGTAAAGSVPIGVMTTIPVDNIVVTYWPSRHPENAQTATFATTTAEANAHAVALARATTEAQVPVVQNCSLLHGTTPHTAYEGSVSATDATGATVYATLYFNSTGTPTIPTVHILTVGDNGLIVQASHRSDQTAESRVYAGNSANLGTCDAPLEAAIQSYDLTETSYDREQLNAYNQDLHYDRVQQSYSLVQEGTHLLVCERLFAGTGAPSWERTTPVYESSMLVESPDRINPLISVSGVTGVPSDLTGTISAATIQGEECGSPHRFVAHGLFPANETICGPDLTTGAGTRLQGDALAVVGYTGDFSIRINGSWGSHHDELIGARVLTLSEGLCRGDCALPIDDHYTIPLNAPDRSHVGSAGIVVTWHQGNTDGDRTWVIGAATAVTPLALGPARPQLDTDNLFELDRVDPTDHTDTMRYVLSTDRPVTYSLTLGGNGSAMCTVPGSVTTASGSTTAGIRSGNTATIYLSKLCAGSSYVATITLVDANGVRAVWGMTGETDRWGPGAVVIAPGIPVTIHYIFNGFGIERSFVDDLDMYWGGFDFGIHNSRGGWCSPDGVIFDNGYSNVDAPTQGTFAAQFRTSQSRTFTPTSCRNEVNLGRLSTVSTPLTLSQLLGYDGVTIRSSDGEIVVQMWATLGHS